MKEADLKKFGSKKVFLKFWVVLSSMFQRILMIQYINFFRVLCKYNTMIRLDFITKSY